MSRAAELTVPFAEPKLRGVCMRLCQHDGGDGCYSDLMNPSAFRGHSSSYADGSKRTATREPGQREGWGGGGGRLLAFSKKYK